jgi:hypothetical protein
LVLGTSQSCRCCHAGGAPSSVCRQVGVICRPLLGHPLLPSLRPVRFLTNVLRRQVPAWPLINGWLRFAIRLGHPFFAKLRTKQDKVYPAAMTNSCCPRQEVCPFRQPNPALPPGLPLRKGTTPCYVPGAGGAWHRSRNLPGGAAGRLGFTPGALFASIHIVRNVRAGSAVVMPAARLTSLLSCRRLGGGFWGAEATPDLPEPLYARKPLPATSSYIFTASQ